MSQRLRFSVLTTFVSWFCISVVAAQFVDYKDNIVNNEGVKIHYVTKGSGPTLVFLHGFPDFWFTWKQQMDQLASDYKVVGVDLRGYNYSDGPSEVEAYKMGTLMSDVIAVMDDLKSDPVILIANDWGGAIAWQLATYYPNRVKGLVACNIPHPSSLKRYLDQHPRVADYTSKMTGSEATGYWNTERLMEVSGANKTSLANAYREAFDRSKVQGVLNYYAASYPKPTKTAAPSPEIKKVDCPVLMIHGMADSAFPPGTLNDHWELVNKSLTIHAIKNAGHFVQREEPEVVLRYIREWLTSLE